MTHERFQERILDLAYGELTAGEARAVEAHAASCADCAAELARIRATRRLMGALPEEPAPESGERVLLAAAREAVRDRARVRSRLLPGWAWSASAVAALVVAVGAVSYRLLELRPAAERAGEELLGSGPYAEAPAPAALAEPQAAKGAATSRAPDVAPPSHAPVPAPHEPAAKRRGGEATTARRTAPRAEVAQAPAERLAHAPPAQPQEEPTASAKAASRAESPVAEADAPSAAEAEVVAGFAAPPEVAREAPSRRGVPAPRSRSAGAPAPAAAPAPAQAERAADAARVEDAPAEDALARYGALRAAGALSGEVRTFPGCEGEAWRKVERDAGGRIVKYVREGRVSGVRVRVEHLFETDGRLALVKATDLDRGGAIDPGALGLTLPRDAAEADPDAPPRCGR